jgi:hypothetical protein
MNALTIQRFPRMKCLKCRWLRTYLTPARCQWDEEPQQCQEGTDKTFSDIARTWEGGDRERE